MYLRYVQNVPLISADFCTYALLSMDLYRKCMYTTGNGVKNIIIWSTYGSIEPFSKNCSHRSFYPHLGDGFIKCRCSRNVYP